MVSPDCEFIDPPEEFDIKKDPGKRTALHLAIVNQRSEVVNTLLQYKGMTHYDVIILL